MVCRCSARLKSIRKSASAAIPENRSRCSGRMRPERKASTRWRVPSPRDWKPSQLPHEGQLSKLIEGFVFRLCGLAGHLNLSLCGIFEETYVRAKTLSTTVAAATARLRELARSWNESRARGFDRDGCPFLGCNSRSSAVHSRHGGARRRRGRFAELAAQSRIARG